VFVKWIENHNLAFDKKEIFLKTLQEIIVPNRHTNGSTTTATQLANEISFINDVKFAVENLSSESLSLNSNLKPNPVATEFKSKALEPKAVSESKRLT
ncbi:MAG: hypothetical protein SFV53_02150, partial [Rickettsiales bacterium]|nr:hypothetical protein [Rickettsiales bacterium]